MQNNKQVEIPHNQLDCSCNNPFILDRTRTVLQEADQLFSDW